MLFPSFICVDNFFDNPDEVVNLSKKFEYENKTHCPGKRTKALHELDWAFFNWVNLKIASVLYPNNLNDLRFKSFTYFQKVNKLQHDSWVHTDNKFKATAIIYLNKEDTAGTSIFAPKDFRSTLVQKYTDTKYEYFTKEENRTKELEEKVGKAKEDNNQNFQKTFSVEGIYNRLVIFDGNSYHAANPMTNSNERLTLITFFDDISLEEKIIKYPIPTMRAV